MCITQIYDQSYSSVEEYITINHDNCKHLLFSINIKKWLISMLLL